jgi:hypothetical protein
VTRRGYVADGHHGTALVADASCDLFVADLERPVSRLLGWALQRREGRNDFARRPLAQCEHRRREHDQEVREELVEVVLQLQERSGAQEPLPQREAEDIPVPTLVGASPKRSNLGPL